MRKRSSEMTAQSRTALEKPTLGSLLGVLWAPCAVGVFHLSGWGRKELIHTSWESTALERHAYYLAAWPWGSCQLSPQVFCEDTGKPMSFLQDPVVNFNAENPCLLEKANQTQIKTVKELAYLITEVPWNSSLLWEPFVLLPAAVRGETESTTCLVNKVGKQHPHWATMTVPCCPSWGEVFSISGLPSAYLQLPGWGFRPSEAAGHAPSSQHLCCCKKFSGLHSETSHVVPHILTVCWFWAYNQTLRVEYSRADFTFHLLHLWNGAREGLNPKGNCEH